MPERRARAPRPRRPAFRPNFFLVVIYVAAFTVLFGLMFALPGLVEGARQLGPGPAQLSPEEMAQARRIAAEAVGGGRLVVAFLAAALAVGVGVWARLLPGLR